MQSVASEGKKRKENDLGQRKMQANSAVLSVGTQTLEIVLAVSVRTNASVRCCDGLA